MHVCAKKNILTLKINSVKSITKHAACKTWKEIAKTTLASFVLQKQHNGLFTNRRIALPIQARKENAKA